MRTLFRHVVPEFGQIQGSVIVHVVLPSSIDKSQRDFLPGFGDPREGLRMKSNLQGRKDDRNGACGHLGRQADRATGCPAAVL